MSVTFTASNTTYALVTKPCDMTGCTAENRCGYCDNGSLDYEASGPEVNFHNAGAGVVLRLLGLYDEYLCGSVEAEQIPALRQRILVAKNSSCRRASEVYEPSMSVGENGATLYSGGMSHEDIIRRLEAIETVLAHAEAHNAGMRWG